MPELSKASSTFLQAIKDAENLLGHFNKLNLKPPPPENEVLKRAGLVMAMTAWETYVEDRLMEATEARLQGLSDPTIAKFVLEKLVEEIRKLHNPDAVKTVSLFRQFAGVDLENSWRWNNTDPKSARDRLNEYLSLRGQVVHRSRIEEAGPPRAHPVTKEKLVQVIRFLKELVGSTEQALEPALSSKAIRNFVQDSA